MFKFLKEWTMSASQRHYLLSQKLGDKHPKTIEASKLLGEEYALCFQQEQEFLLKLPFSLWSLMRLSQKNALRLAEGICKEMNAPNILGVGENEKWQWAEAYYHYRDQRIHGDFPMRITSFLHELTHHIQSHIDFWEPFREQHGKKFCEIEMKVFDVVLKGANG